MMKEKKLVVQEDMKEDNYITYNFLIQINIYKSILFLVLKHLF